MILRSVIRHVRNQEWTAIVLDFLIVVVGVFIGIQVANWNAARVESAELDQQLVSLRIELEENQKHFDTYQAKLQKQMDDVLFLRSAFEVDPLKIEPDEFNLRLLNVQRVQELSPDLTALKELAETGGLRRLLGTDIRLAVADWEKMLATVQRLQGDALTQRDHVFNPYMMSEIAYGPLMEQSWLVGDTIGQSRFRNDIPALAGDRQFDNHLAYRYGINGSISRYLEDLRSKTEDLIVLLKIWEERHDS
jgi:hypothetical protein